MSPTEGREYGQLLLLAALFDSSASDLRTRAALGERILRDPAVADSAELAPTTFAQLDDDVRAATTGEHGLVAGSVELDADALIVRATVQTYRWIDELQDAAYRTLGSIAGRAIGYLAPEVALGGAVVSAGLIETDALDRDDVAAYLAELAESNPELLDHMTTGGGLIDGLRMRSLLTAGVPLGDAWTVAARGGLRFVGEETFSTDLGSALRDMAGGVVDAPVEIPVPTPHAGDRPHGLEDLMAGLGATSDPVAVHEVAPARYLAYVPGVHRSGSPLKLVGGDLHAYTDLVVRAIETAVGTHADPPRVMLVGWAQGGVISVDIAVRNDATSFVVDQVVTAGAPGALVARIPNGTRVLSLEDRADPVALFGSLVNAGSDNRLTIVFDSDGEPGSAPYIAGGRAADTAAHPELRQELDRMRELGFLD